MLGLGHAVLGEPATLVGAAPEHPHRRVQVGETAGAAVALAAAEEGPDGHGGAGLDVFLFNTTLGPGNIDTVQDFVVVDDTIWLENGVFTALVATGPPVAGQLRAGAGVTTAADANDFLLYNSSTGALSYDSDGNGSAALPMHFALLGVGLALALADFVVV